MKPFQFSSLKVLAAIVACTLVAGSADVGAGTGDVSQANARLVVHRAADFGTEIYLNVFVDGVQVTMLPINTGYEALLRPGNHVLAISTSPCPYGKTRYTYKHVRMEPGQNYAYTAIWEYADTAELGPERIPELERNRTWY